MSKMSSIFFGNDDDDEGESQDALDMAPVGGLIICKELITPGTEMVWWSVNERRDLSSFQSLIEPSQEPDCSVIRAC